MAPASPSAIAAVSDRPALTRLDSRGPAAPEEAGAGLPFAGLMAHAVETPEGPEDSAPVAPSPDEGEPLPPGEPDPSQAAVAVAPMVSAPPPPLAPEPVSLATALPSPAPQAVAAGPAPDPAAPPRTASRPAPEGVQGNPGMPPLPERPGPLPAGIPVGPTLPEVTAPTEAPLPLPSLTPTPISTGTRPPEPAFLAEIVPLPGAAQVPQPPLPEAAGIPLAGGAQPLKAVPPPPDLASQPPAPKPSLQERGTAPLGGTAGPTQVEAETPPTAAPSPAQGPLPSQVLPGSRPWAEPALHRTPEPQGADLLPAALLPLKAPAPPAVAAPAAATASTPAPAPILTQVEGGFRWMLKGGSQEARLQLHPESLGQVTIHLKVEGGEVHARLWITEPASVQALQEARPHLELSLREQGLQLGSFDLQQGHRPFQETPSAPERPGPRGADLPPDRQEAPAGPLPSVLNPHRVELYA